MGISSRPPREFSLTSAGTKRPGQVTTRRKSMSRRVIVLAGKTEPEIRQRGYVYQKGCRKTDPWLPEKRDYCFCRLDFAGIRKAQSLNSTDSCKRREYSTRRRFGNGSPRQRCSARRQNGGSGR